MSCGISVVLVGKISMLQQCLIFYYFVITYHSYNITLYVHNMANMFVVLWKSKLYSLYNITINYTIVIITIYSDNGAVTEQDESGGDKQKSVNTLMQTSGNTKSFNNDTGNHVAKLLTMSIPSPS